MKQFYLGLIFLTIAFSSLHAYEITLTDDSEIPKVEVVANIDGKHIKNAHKTPTYILRPGQSKKWNHGIIRREFGRDSKKVELRFFDAEKTDSRGMLRKKYKVHHEIGRATFNIDDTIQVKITKYQRKDPTNITRKRDYNIKAWVE